MKTIILSICIVACFLQFTKANEKCHKYMKEIHEIATDLAEKNELHKCLEENGIPRPSKNHDEFKAKMREWKGKWKNLSKEERQRIEECLNAVYLQIKALMKEKPLEECETLWKEKYEECNEN